MIILFYLIVLNEAKIMIVSIGVFFNFVSLN